MWNDTEQNCDKFHCIGRCNAKCPRVIAHGPMNKSQAGDMTRFVSACRDAPPKRRKKTGNAGLDFV